MIPITREESSELASTTENPRISDYFDELERMTDGTIEENDFVGDIMKEDYNFECVRKCTVISSRLVC